MVKTVKINDKNVEIRVPPNSRIPIDTPPHLFTHHGIQLYVGKRGQGKSVGITNYLRMMKEAGKSDRVFIISPTVLSNKALLDSLGVEESDILDPDDPAATQKLKSMIDDERDEYEEYFEKKKRWKELQKLMKDMKITVDEIDPDLLLDFANEFGELEPPVPKYGHEGIPVLHCFIDDCQSSALFRDRKFLNFCIRHRHSGGLKRGGAVGVSLYIAIQNLKAQQGGCPRAIRNNCTQMILVGKSKDKSELEDIYSSIAGEVDFDDFMKAYEYATEEPHNSLVIDFHPKPEHPSRFRKNFNEYIIPEKLNVDSK